MVFGQRKKLVGSVFFFGLCNFFVAQLRVLMIRLVKFNTCVFASLFAMMIGY